MCSTRSTLKLILVSYLVAFLAECSDKHVIAPFDNLLMHREENYQCYGAVYYSHFLLAPAYCFNGIDHTKYAVFIESEVHEIALIKHIKDSDLVVAALKKKIIASNINATRFNSMCENSQSCGIRYSCSRCDDTDFSNSYFDYNDSSDLVYNDMKIAHDYYLALHLNAVSQRAKDKSVIIKNEYYESIHILYANYLVQIRKANDEIICAGALISDMFVVTAADCFDGIDHTQLSRLVVVAGVNTVNEYGVRESISRVTIHPEYNVATKKANIAVIKVNKAFWYGDFGETTIGIIPLCDKQLKENDLVKLNGWGLMAYLYTNPISTTILPVIAKENCLEDFNATAEHGIFCVKGKNVEFEFGVSDFGGPAIFNGQLCGIASSCSNCDDFNYTTSFTDVFYFREFIQHVVTQSVEAKSHASKPQTSKANLYSTTKIKDAPYLVQIREESGTFICAGVLVSNISVLTAASCFADVYDYTQLVVVGGAETLTESGVQRRIAKMAIPNQFELNTYSDNIAILKLNESLTSDDSDDDNIASLSMYDNKSVHENQYVHVLGWRHMSTNDPGAHILSSTFIKVTSEETCRREFPGVDTDGVFCAVGNDYDNQFSVSDFGGPVFRGSKLIGIAYQCTKCSDIDYINVFTDVHHFATYIEDALAGKYD